MKQQIEFFTTLHELVDKMNASNSSLDKIEVLKQYESNEFIKKVLLYTYNPFFNFYVTSENCVKRDDLCEGDHIDLFELLYDLNNRKITGHSAIAAVNNFAGIMGDFGYLVYLIVDRNLEIRVDTKTINKVFKDLIPTYSCALALTYDEKTKKKVDFIKDAWFVSRKLDGVRCQLIIDNEGEIKTYSREGREFKTLQVIKDKFQEFAKTNRNIVFDGEICIVKENGEDDFQGVMKQISKKDHSITNARYYIFDVIGLDIFNDLSKGDIFSKRQEDLSKYASIISNPMIVHLPQILIKNEVHFQEWKEEAVKNNWEGVILRKDTFYNGKRSADILKVKEWNEEDYIAESIEIGDFRIIKNGIEETIETMTNINFKHKGCLVSCGSGFSLDQRNEFYKNPEKIVKHKVSIKFFEETIDQKGGYSLRFPIFKGIRNYE